jgi:hypothetical protein
MHRCYRRLCLSKRHNTRTARLLGWALARTDQNTTVDVTRFTLPISASRRGSERGGSQQRQASLHGGALGDLGWAARATAGGRLQTTRNKSRTCWRCAESQLTRLHSNVYTTAATVLLTDAFWRQATSDACEAVVPKAICTHCTATRHSQCEPSDAQQVMHSCWLAAVGENVLVPP